MNRGGVVYVGVGACEKDTAILAEKSERAWGGCYHAVAIVGSPNHPQCPVILFSL